MGLCLMTVKISHTAKPDRPRTVPAD